MNIKITLNIDGVDEVITERDFADDYKRCFAIEQIKVDTIAYLNTLISNFSVEAPVEASSSSLPMTLKKG